MFNKGNDYDQRNNVHQTKNPMEPPKLTIDDPPNLRDIPSQEPARTLASSLFSIFF